MADGKGAGPAPAAPSEGPRILVTNDDGIAARGLEVLEAIARAISPDVWTVAPETNQSGTAHSLTLRRPLRVRRLAARRIAVDGTPTDCVLLGLQHLVKGRPVDLVLSGVNHGHNLGEDVTYSGTVSAAMEATLLKVRAIALSLACKPRRALKWATAERWGPGLVRRLAGAPWAEGVLMNVNFPDVLPARVRGVAVVGQGQRKLGDHIVERRDPRGEPYVWIGALREADAFGPGTDLAAVAAGYVAVTPIHLDMTHRPSLGPLAAALGGAAGPAPARDAPSVPDLAVVRAGAA